MNDLRQFGDVLCRHCEKSTPGTISRQFFNDAKRVLDQDRVRDLAAAVRASGSIEAERALDRLFVDEPVISEWIALARCQS